MSPSTEVRLPTGEPPEVAAEVVAVSRALREEAMRYVAVRVGAAIALVLAVLVWIALELRGTRIATEDCAAQLALRR